MNIHDAHCDVLCKMWLDPSLSFENGDGLHTNLNQMRKAGAKLQLFAIYVPESVPDGAKFDCALEMVDIFHEKVIKPYDDVVPVYSKEDAENIPDGKIGAMLTLEGCDAIGKEAGRLKTLLRLGVRSVGLTWNYGNATADGILESRGAGLSDFGRSIVDLHNQHRIWTDVSHLSVRAFWDVIDQGRYVIASHSNAKAICTHPRNLDNQQLTALIEKDSFIGVTFVPKFLRNDRNASVSDIIHHIEHICSLGGTSNIGLGSDFDGIKEVPAGLECYEGYSRLIEELNRYYSKEQVDGFLGKNLIARMP
ncbi:dipeptidase [Guptibacillus hwajinpoensis]|uniref:Membrane dipeptidase n=1 Tax=Guptibacillus hwajinpoensis TaxID=208199 RepID=A0ABU0K3S7_9BACL|nr:dipeptidase [Alkalihalobacillus hemicentroti]MDQ0482934.1 membrane dipeptidase [Alkalihalobacillus hemicentroti]